MAGYKIQLKDKNGNRQYPVSTVDVVVDADGVSVADLLDRKQPTLVSGVNIKTINGKTLLGEGDLVIEGGTADLSGYATEEYVDAKVGESYPIYYSHDGTPLTEEQKAANKMAVDKYVADESIVLYPHMGSVRHPFDVMLTLSEGAWKTAELTNYLFAYFNDDGTTMHYVKVTVGQDGDVQVEFSAQSPLVLASKKYVDSKVGGGSGETAESDVICVVWDDDTSDIPSNKEAYQKLAECCETVGKPAAVMVCVETGYRWGIEHFYWKTRFEDIELVTPVRNDGMYAIFTLTSEGVCTADFKQVSLGGGGESVLGNNVITLYEPTIDGDTDEIVSTDECLAEIENNFGYDIEIPQEIKDAVSAFIISMKEHNTAEYARAKELTENGEKVMVMLRGYGYPMILLGIYLIALVETGKPPVTSEEFLSDFNALTSMEEMIFPQRYIAADSIEGEFGIEVAHDRYALQPDENGEWTITSTESVRKYAILYYEGTARLTAQQCETNLKSKGNRLNNCDFQVNRYRGDGWSDNEDVLIISKSTKTVSNFVNLNGDVVTCGVTSFQYIEDTKLIELQVSNEDGYCRRVVIGDVVTGSSAEGGLKYFVERYVYEGKTEEERTYNLESLAMAEQGVDILWAGLESIGLSTYLAAGAWYLRLEQGMFVSILEAHIDTDGTFVFQTRSFCRVFMPTTNTEMKEYMKAFFKEESWPHEQAYYGVFPIISWSDETETSIKAYFLSNGLAIAHAVIDTETGEVGQAAVGQ
jgi:hypothetical protein